MTGRNMQTKIINKELIDRIQTLELENTILRGTISNVAQYLEDSSASILSMNFKAHKQLIDSLGQMKKNSCNVEVSNKIKEWSDIT